MGHERYAKRWGLASPMVTLSKAYIMTVINSWREWVKIGCPKHGHDSGGGMFTGRGYWGHDNYHEHIEQTDDPAILKYRVQTDDSPDGDTWCGGTVRLLNGGTDIDILSTHWEYT